MTIIEKLRQSVERRAAYNRTFEELSRLPLDVALDLGINRSDAHRLAYQAVYGA